ncbi:MAG: PQQ-binding-like beta-propeller repeat protein [Planctomycetaceae bacterium]
MVTGSVGPRVWLALCLGLAVPAKAADWPQILGPDRNGVASDDEKLLPRWPDGGPSVVWERPVGSGVAGIAVQGPRAILFHRRGDEEIVEALDVNNGQTQWQSKYPTTFRPQVGGEDGPLCVPTIVDGRVVTFGAQGVLSCLDLTSGRLLWRRKTHDDFDAREGYFGAGSSPVLWGDQVIVNVGGFRSQAAVVSFDVETGETLWHLYDDHASYSSPRVVTIDGQERLLVETRLNFLLIDPTEGKLMAEIPFGGRGPTVNGANPVLLGDQLFLTASYNIGALLARLSSAAITESWRADSLYSSQYCTPVSDGAALYGVDGRQDGPPGELKCFDPITQRVLWSQPDFGYGTMILLDGKLVILRTDGTLILATANRERFDPLATTRVLTGTARALPAMSNGRLYVRDETTLKSLQIGITPANTSSP